MKVKNNISRIELVHGQGEPNAGIVWLHGLGATADDFVPVVPHLGLDDQHVIKFVFPQAPDRPITINGGMRMPGWYDIKGLQIEDKQDAEGIKQSAELVATLINEMIDDGIPSERIILAGFSQGGAIAYYQGLRQPEKLAGLINLSTYLVFDWLVEDEGSAANKTTPILIQHGTYDAVVPLNLGQESAAKLKELGYPVTWNEYKMEHQVIMEQILDIGTWINQQLSAS
ncbi:MAG: carboxylesterase [Pseudomonadota bacterium]